MRKAVQALLAAAALLVVGTRFRSDGCPTEIRATIPAWKDEAAFTSMAGIHAAMLKCPNIATLQVRTTLLGCSEWPDRFNFPFDIAGGDRYPSAPVVLSLDGYEGAESEWKSCQDTFARLVRFSYAPTLEKVWQCVRWYFTVPAAQKAKTNMDLWLDAMDFSRIHTLQLNHTGGHYTLTEEVVGKLAPRLSSLESLLVYYAIAEKLILALPQNSLKHLSWQHPTDKKSETGKPTHSPLRRVLQHHGSTLQSLEYHTDESEYRPTPALTLSDLQELVTLTPNLRTLTLDLNREPSTDAPLSVEDWPWPSLKTLAEGLPHLSDLTIYFPLASECHRQRQQQDRPEDAWRIRSRCEGECLLPERYASPMLNKTSAREMARFLLRHRTGEQRKLERITFRAGDWTPAWDGPLRWEGWLDGQRVWVTCTVRGASIKGQGMRGEGEGPGDGDVVCEGGDTLMSLGDWEERCALRSARDEDPWMPRTIYID